MEGALRVIVFCLLTAFIPILLLALPLYLRHSVFADVTYLVAESDVVQIANGISSVFCQEHVLSMSSSFSAFQVASTPKRSSANRKHIRLKKSMSLADDTLEYWGFFLPTGSTVYLSVCSRYDGSRILVVKGEKTLRDCGLMDGIGSEELPQPAEGGVVAIESGSTERPARLEPSYDGEQVDEEEPARRRTRSNQQLDGGIAHGGNFASPDHGGHDSSISSFELSLLTCYDGQILLSQGFAPSAFCNSTRYLESGRHLQTTHQVVDDGYYYYIFYSDNDYVRNDIHAIFDIHKPTYLYENHSAACINRSSCVFPIRLWSSEVVVVEVPTTEGIRLTSHDLNLALVSSCRPRTLVYALFPILILAFILLFAFI